jgi:hypothetical protein
MKTSLIAAVTIVVVLTALFIFRVAVRRYRRLHRIELAERRVSEAMADGRLAKAFGEALLQHLDGLRRACARWRQG